MKRAILFSNGELTDLRRLKKLLKHSDFLIGVDGGTNQILKLGLKPNLIIGDLDSLTKIPKDTKVLKLANQNKTDIQKAIEQATKMGYEEVLLVGFLGRRLDHMISSLMIVAKSKLNIKIIEGNQEMQVIKDKITLKGKPGDLVSLIPLLGDCQKITTEGLKWRLQGRTLKCGKGLGVSNVMLGKTAKVSLKKGCLLVLVTRM